MNPVSKALFNAIFLVFVSTASSSAVFQPISFILHPSYSPALNAFNFVYTTNHQNASLAKTVSSLNSIVILKDGDGLQQAGHILSITTLHRFLLSSTLTYHTITVQNKTNSSSVSGKNNYNTHSAERK